MSLSSETTGTTSDTVASWRRDLVTGAFGVLLVAGVFTDGWAHFNRPGLESFFTPWHAVLYSGLGATTARLAFVAFRASGGRVTGVVPTLPAGYGLALVGAGLFGLGGLADLVWHEVFGIEVAVDALISPTHLLLGAGGVLILSTGMRAQGVLGAGSRSPRWTAPALMSLALTLAVVVFFLLYTSPFPVPGPVEAFTPRPEGAPGHEAAELPAIASLTTYLVSSVVITLPVLLMLRSRKFPRGALVLVVATVSLLPVIVLELPRVATSGALGAVVGAAVAEIAVPSLIRGVPQFASWAVPGLLLGLVWSGQLAGLALADTLRWPVSLWSGAVVLGALLAAATGFVAGPRPRDRSGEEEPRPA